MQKYNLKYKGRVIIGCNMVILKTYELHKPEGNRGKLMLKGLQGFEAMDM